jgi:outer membrane protein insertion porin family
MRIERFAVSFLTAVLLVSAPALVFAQETSSGTVAQSPEEKKDAGQTPAAVAASPASAAVPADNWYYGKLIKSVTFQGLKHVESKEVDGITSGFIGRPFSDEVFSDMLDRIYALDLFDDVNPQAVPGDEKRTTVSIVFTVKERPVITRIFFNGNKQLRTAELKDAIAIKDKDVYVESKALVDERAIRDLYLGKGYTNIKVSSTTKTTDKGIEVTFVIDEGRATVIKTLAFRGNKVVSSKTLKGKLKLKEVSLFNKGAFQESELEADKQAIVAYYKNNGYIDASIVDVTRDVSINEAKNRDELTITFVVQEGSQYSFGGISFKGNSIFSDAQLQALVKIKNGSVFNETKFNESTMAVADLYYENGYTSNRFVPLASKDAENKVISYVLQVTENVRSHVENVIIKGNTRTKDYVIRRELPIESGDIFSKAKITTGLRNLYNLQYFSAIVPDVVPGSEENLVDLVLTVEEQSTTSIEFGVTFSGVSDPNDLPFALFVKWQDSNVKGLGKTVSVSSTISTDEQSVSLSYGENWLWGLPINTSISTDFSHSSLSSLRLKVLPDGTIDSDSYYMDYEQWKWSLGLSAGHRWTPDWAIMSLSGGVSGSLINNSYDTDLYTPVDTTISEYANTWGWQNSIWSAFSIDDRDVNYDPSKGWFASQRLTWYGLTPLESEFFLRTDTKLEDYFTLLNVPVTEKWNLKLVFAAYSGLSMLFPIPGTTLGDSSRLYIDGMFNGRGWTSIYNTVRGKALWSNYAELRMPVVPGVLASDWLFDAAVIKNEPSQLFNDLSVEDFYFSTGPDIRFSIPQFPLRLLFENTFRVSDGEVQWNKNWKFVLSFNITNK